MMVYHRYLKTGIGAMPTTKGNEGIAGKCQCHCHHSQEESVSKSKRINRGIVEITGI